MKLPLIVLAGLLATPFNSNAQTSITAPNGYTFHFGEWSQPTVLPVKSAQGQTQLISRTCTVDIQQPSHPETQQLQLLFYPEANEVWIGEVAANAQYVVVGKKIWGLSASESALRIQPSAAAEDAASGGDLNVEKYLTKYLADPRPILWTDGTTKRFDLRRIFGVEAILAQNGMGEILRLTNVLVAADRVTANIRNVATGLDLSLSVTSDYTVLEAFRGKEQLPVLWDTPTIAPELLEWAILYGKQVLAAGGNQPAVACNRHYQYLDDSGQSQLRARVEADVLLGTGDFWIGPEDCNVVVLEGKMLGILMNRAKCEIQVFKGQPVRLPRSPASAPLFQAQLRQFEATFPANEYRFEPEWKLNVLPLFADDKRLTTDWAINKIRIQNHNIIINCYGGSAQAYPEITLGPDLTVVSTRVLGEDWQDVIRQ